ncbi:DNA-binding HxlR family transcriptional regulator [Nocardioides aromaticivorans]|uniref:DNA-binding HxlR family transcriptional regulator n=1 Tax=Nocardioides aromaticivorans TaxID=200618 RepID=A0A7Z0CND0_9ACTN|nr:helix-turn-helix domain-containing protein [Nocardioides aromaticivorans]NYI45058.1 DNA-binding HxlR family transcriptional regulator [Nocardioides aromaticivorans]
MSITTDHHPLGVPATEFCAISAGTRLLGDRWTLMVVHEMLGGARRFNEIHRGLPTLSRSMLAARLRNLERMGVALKQPVQGTNWHEYVLTPSGMALRDVLAAMGSWASTWQLSPETPVGVPALLVGLQRSLQVTSLPQPKVCIEFQFPQHVHSRGWLHAERRHVRSSVDGPEADVDLLVQTSPVVLDDLWHGRRVCEQTIAAGEIRFTGPGQLVQGFRHWFRPAEDPTD